MVLSLGSSITNENMCQTIDDSRHATDLPLEGSTQAPSVLPPKWHRMLSAKSIRSMTSPGFSMVESAATPSRSLSLTSRNETISSLSETPLPRPSKPPNDVDIRTTSLGSTSGRSSNQRVPSPVSLFSINESIIPTAHPPIHLRLPPRHQRSSSAPIEQSVNVRPHTAHGMTPAARRSKVELFPPNIKLQLLKRPTSSSGGMRPHTIYNTPEYSPGRPSSGHRTLVLQESPEPLSSPTSPGFKSAWTWAPPDSWSGPPVSEENPAKKLRRSNSKSKLKTGNQSTPRFTILSPSFWKLSSLTRGAQGDAKKYYVNGVPPKEQGCQDVLVTVEGRHGMTENATVIDIIPQLRELKSVPH